MTFPRLGQLATLAIVAATCLNAEAQPRSSLTVSAENEVFLGDDQPNVHWMIEATDLARQADLRLDLYRNGVLIDQLPASMQTRVVLRRVRADSQDGRLEITVPESDLGLSGGDVIRLEVAARAPDGSRRLGGGITTTSLDPVPSLPPQCVVDCICAYVAAIKVCKDGSGSKITGSDAEVAAAADALRTCLALCPSGQRNAGEQNITCQDKDGASITVRIEVHESAAVSVNAASGSHLVVAYSGGSNATATNSNAGGSAAAVSGHASGSGNAGDATAEATAANGQGGDAVADAGNGGNGTTTGGDGGDGTATTTNSDRTADGTGGDGGDPTSEPPAREGGDGGDSSVTTGGNVDVRTGGKNCGSGKHGGGARLRRVGGSLVIDQHDTCKNNQ